MHARTHARARAHTHTQTHLTLFAGYEECITGPLNRSAGFDPRTGPWWLGFRRYDPAKHMRCKKQYLIVTRGPQATVGITAVTFLCHCFSKWVPRNTGGSAKRW